MSILGNRVLRKEDAKFLTVGGTYVDDTAVPGAAWVAYVRSPFAHARITGVSVDAARQAPGVLDVVTGADLGLAPIPPGIPIINAAMVRPVLAQDVVRFVGEAVVAVIAESRAEAADAAELVEVDYDPLPAVVDPRAAAESETLLFPEAGTNVAFEMAPELDPGFFEGCDVVVHQSVVNQRLAPCPLEVRSAAASWGDDGRVTLWVSSQAPFGVRASLAALLGGDFRQAEIEELGVAAFGDKDIRGLDIAMNDAAGMGGIERVGDFDANFELTLGADRGRTDQAIERLALEQLHDEERATLPFTDVVDGADVRVIE